MTKNLKVSKQLGLIASLALAMAAAMLGTMPASAAMAAPSGLSPNGVAVSGIPTLAWNHVSGATSYNVEMSSSSTFETLLFSSTTTNRHATPTKQLPTGEVWWRVRSVGAAGTSPWALSAVDSNPKAGPVPLSPDHDEVLTQPSNPPLLSWTSVRGAVSYQVEIDGSEGDFVDTVVYPTQTTSLVVPDPQEYGVYTWRVRGVLGTGLYTEWSEDSGRIYRIGPLPVVEGNVDPSNDASFTVEDVVFDWSPVSGAVSYDIQVDDDDSFSAPVNTAVVKGTRYSPSVTLDNDQYWWRVRARNIFGQAQEWDQVPVRQFRRAWAPTPELLFPEDNATQGDDLFYQWTPVRLATRYRMDIGQDANFSPGTYASCFTTETTYTPGRFDSGRNDACMPVPGRTYYWRIQALDGPRGPEVNGISSSIRKFVYDPGSVTLTSPAAGATVDIPTLRWQPAPDAIEYDVVLSWNGGSKAVTTQSYSWTPTLTKLDPTKGPFSWTVQAVDRNGVSSPLPIVGRTFDISGDVPTTGAAPLTPLSPVQSASATPRFPNLTWEPVEVAAYYKLHIGSAGSGFFDTLTDKFPYPAGSDISGSRLQTGSYDWFVTAHNSGGTNLGTGPIGRFTIGDLAPVSGQKLSLHGLGLDTPGSSCDHALTRTGVEATCDTMNGTPVLDWAPVPDAGYYMIYVSRDREFTNLVYGSKSSPSTIPATQNTRWNPLLALPDSQAGSAYYWFIRPCKTPGACAGDPLSATHAFDKRSTQVELLTPAAETSVSNDITFTWSDYLATNQKPINRDDNTGEQSSQAARGYHLQVGTTPAFTTMIDDVTVDQRTYTAFNKTYPEGDLYWRVQPVDGAGNQLTWSAAAKFTKTSPPVTPLSPIGGVSTSTTQPFRWQPLHFAASYDLEVYKDGDVNASPTNRVVMINSKQVAYTAAKPLPASSSKYVWRVRRADLDTRKGAWSDWSDFKVTGGVPGLTSPAANTSVDGREALFTWTAVPGAASYKFERRAPTSSSAAETQTTAGLAWAPTRTITDGSWLWRVTAYDAAGAPMGSTDWRGFTATSVKPDTTRPTVVSKTPVTSTGLKANFVAKFSEPVQNVRGATMKLYMSGRSTPLMASVTLSADKRTATLNPTNNLKSGKTYTARLASSITDLSGNALTAYSWSARAK